MIDKLTFKTQNINGFRFLVLVVLTLTSTTVTLSTDAPDVRMSVNESWDSFPIIGQGKTVSFTPHGMARDSSGRLIAVDKNKAVILVLTSTFEIEAVIGRKDRNDLVTLHSKYISAPSDVAVDSQNRFYVTDYGNNKVHVFNQDLVYLGNVFLGAGAPWSVAVDSEDRVIVGVFWGGGGSRIRVYHFNTLLNPPFVLNASFRFTSPGDKFCGTPHDITVDSLDRILIAEGSSMDVSHEQIVIFNKDLTWNNTVGSKGYGPGQFLNLLSIAVGPDDSIVVGDVYFLDDLLSFFFRNGTYAGRISGYDSGLFGEPRSLLVMESEGILIGEAMGSSTKLRLVDISWDQLRPRKTGTVPIDPTPIPENIIIYYILFPLFLVSWVSIEGSNRGPLEYRSADCIEKMQDFGDKVYCTRFNKTALKERENPPD